MAIARELEEQLKKAKEKSRERLKGYQRPRSRTKKNCDCRTSF